MVERAIITMKSVMLENQEDNGDANLALIEYNYTTKYNLQSSEQMLVERSLRTLIPTRKYLLKWKSNTTRTYNNLLINSETISWFITCRSWKIKSYSFSIYRVWSSRLGTSAHNKDRHESENFDDGIPTPNWNNRKTALTPLSELKTNGNGNKTINIPLH